MKSTFFLFHCYRRAKLNLLKSSPGKISYQLGIFCWCKGKRVSSFRLQFGEMSEADLDENSKVKALWTNSPSSKMHGGEDKI